MTTRSADPLIDIISHGRKAADPKPRLSVFQIEQIRRTVNRTPEVMIKVTGGAGANSARGIAAHFSYIGRRGKVDLETDDGDQLRGRDAGKQLLHAWDLDIDLHRRRPELFAVNHRKPPKLIHRLVLSMPAGTPPKKVLAAVREFARQEFGLVHRYAMALHTDEPHPHVHVVVKAVSEEGVRLNIRKETLRQWRQEFAKQLRAQGVAANATPRALRGQARTRKSDGIYRAAMRGESTHMYRKVAEAAHMLNRPQEQPDPVKVRMLRTRVTIEHGWMTVARLLDAQGGRELAAAVQRFASNLPPVQTEKEQLAVKLRRYADACRSKLLDDP